MTQLISGQTHRGLLIYWRQTPDANSPDQQVGTTTVLTLIFKRQDGTRYVATGTITINGTGNVAPQATYIPSTADYAALGNGEWFAQVKGVWLDTTVDFSLPGTVEVLPTP